jgi:hypothetical protein
MDSHRPSAEIRREFPPEYSEPPFEVADIVRLYGDAYRAAHTPSFEQGRALHAIETCRNRHCPKCRAAQRSAGVDARELQVLPIQYFHLVFTLPEALNPLARYQPAAVYGTLLRAAGETLQTFARRRWDGDLGILAVLHTWGQTLNLHPHVHYLVSGGALKRDGSAFVRAPKNFLFPTRALAPVFRAIFLRACQWPRQAQARLVLARLGRYRRRRRRRSDLL